MERITTFTSGYASTPIRTTSDGAISRYGVRSARLRAGGASAVGTGLRGGVRIVMKGGSVRARRRPVPRRAQSPPDRPTGQEALRVSSIFLPYEAVAASMVIFPVAMSASICLSVRFFSTCAQFLAGGTFQLCSRPVK